MIEVPERIGPYRYKPNRLIRETRMSLVWSATTVEHRNNRPQTKDDDVVLKVARMSEKNFSLTNQRAIENEEDWLRKLQHPGIIKLRAIEEDRPGRNRVYRARTDLPDQPWFLSMDYLPGGTLKELVAERRNLSIPLALQIARQVALSLNYAHQNGCVHRDIKPTNILFRVQPDSDELTADSQPILIDFGIAVKIGQQSRVSGTLAWMAPEAEAAMRKGNAQKADPSWDIYALGLVLYNMLAGREPPKSVPQVPRKVRIRSEIVKRDPNISGRAVEQMTAGLNRLIASCVDNDPSKRPSARQFAVAADQLLNSISVQAPPARNWLSRALIGGGLATAAFALILVVSNWMGASDPSTVPTPEPGTEDENDQVVMVAPNTPTVAEVSTQITSVQATVELDSEISTMTPISTPISIVTSTATQVENTPTTVRPAALTPTSTSRASLIPATSTPVETSTPIPTSTPVATSTPAQTATNTPTRQIVIRRRTSVLLTPPDSFDVRGRVRFSWSSVNLGPGEWYEVVIWKPGQNALSDARGIASPLRETTLTVVFSDELRRQLEGFLEPGREYLWGVLIVRQNPYRRIQLGSETPRRLTYVQ